jgi:hypothetical protein
MTKVAVSTTEPSGKVYRIPLRRVYKQKHSKEDATWDEVYGKAKCFRCKKPLGEGDPYQIVIEWKVGRLGSRYPVHRCVHVECPQKENK